MNLIYDPQSGYPLNPRITAQEFRNKFPTVIWTFDPWTGVSRTRQCVDDDPFGLTTDSYGLANGAQQGPFKFIADISEADPNGMNPQKPGAKLDAGKSPVRRGLLEYFPRACMAVADISKAGAEKYTWGGWQTVEGGIDRYGDAEVRHICKAAIEGEIDPDFGMLHAAHEAWGAMARLELILREKEKK